MFETFFSRGRIGKNRNIGLRYELNSGIKESGLKNIRLKAKAKA
jgi:hypothetical protein